MIIRPEPLKSAISSFQKPFKIIYTSPSGKGGLKPQLLSFLS